MTSQTIRLTGRSKALMAIAALVISTLLLVFATRHARSQVVAGDLQGDGGIRGAKIVERGAGARVPGERNTVGALELALGL